MRGSLPPPRKVNPGRHVLDCKSIGRWVGFDVGIGSFQTHMMISLVQGAELIGAHSSICRCTYSDLTRIYQLCLQYCRGGTNYLSPFISSQVQDQSPLSTQIYVQPETNCMLASVQEYWLVLCQCIHQAWLISSQCDKHCPIASNYTRQPGQEYWSVCMCITS